MRSVAAPIALAVVALAAAAVRIAPPRAGVRAQAPIATPGDGTPIVDPQPEPTPIYLPAVARDYDAALPGPVGGALEGYVAALTRAGRSACAPATHVLLTRPEGTRGAETVAVIHAARPGPDLNLDFFLGEYVAASGATDLAPEACRIAWRSLRVERIDALDTPPR